MSGRFPALGFDPAPGNPEAVAGCARRLGRVAEELGHQAGALQRATSLTSSWEGSAARAYAGQVGARVAELRAAAEVLGAVSARLLWWSGELRDLQEVARRLERAAVPASAAVCLPGPATELDGLQARARRLQERAEHSARFVAAEVRAAVEVCPAARRFDGWTDAPLGIPVGRWVVRHEDVISDVADTASDGGFVVAVGGLAVAPFAPPVGAAAVLGGVGLGAVALLGHAATAQYGDGSWSAVALDVAGLTAAGVSMRAVKHGLPAVAKAGDRVGHALTAWSAPDVVRRRLGVGTERDPSTRLAPSGSAVAQPHTPQTRRIEATRRAASRRSLDALLVAPVTAP